MDTVNGTDGISAFLADTIKFVCETYKRRSPGTKSERASLEYFAKILRNYADEVKVERFALHPGAFGSVLTVCGALGAFSAVLSVLAATLGTVRIAGVLIFVLLLLSLLLAGIEFVMCRQMYDFLFPRRISKNVYALRKPSGETARRIIFSAHIDSPQELLLGSKSLKKLNLPVLLICAGGLLVSYVMSAIYLFSGCPPVKGTWILYPVIMCVFLPFFIITAFIRKPGKPVEGACSSVTGCAVASAVLASLSEKDERLRETEVGCLITGGHNSGCRGASAFVKAHKKQLMDIPTYVIPIGSVSAGGDYSVCSLDRCGTVRNDMDCAELIIMAGREAGIDISHSDFSLCSTDAAAFSAAGIPACALEAGTRAYGSPVETKADNRKCVSLSTVESVLDVCLACLRKYDETQ